MVGFLIKKVFFDIWDNLLSVIGLSIGYIVMLLGLFLAGMVGEYSSILALVVVVLDILLYSFYSLGVNAITYGYSKYQKEGFKAFKEAFRYHWAHALLHAGLCIALLLILLYIIPFYIAAGNMVTMFLGMLMFWLAVMLFLVMQYFFPLCFHMQGDGAMKTLKKSFIVVSDNVGVSLFLLLRSLLGFALTVVTAGLIPGLAGISLSRMDTLRLLMKKYDFLEENPDCTKKDINWDDLLYEERELVGPRSLKGMIFPWKD